MSGQKETVYTRYYAGPTSHVSNYYRSNRSDVSVQGHNQHLMVKGYDQINRHPSVNMYSTMKK